MALYAIGDLHLSFQTEPPVPMQTMGRIWIDHERILRDNWLRTIRPEDTVVLVGDHSWGRKLDQCEKDFAYIESLPGRKILVRGNHDMFWDAGKTGKLNNAFRGRLSFLQNNFESYGTYALVGTKGYTYEGKDTPQHARMLVERELERLKISFEAACAAGYSRFIMFLHYPPTNLQERSSGFTKMAEYYGAEQVVYVHCHGEARFHDSLLGVRKGIRYSLVSGDYLRWQPCKILD